MAFPTNAWIIDGIRTPIGRYGGALAGVGQGIALAIERI